MQLVPATDEQISLAKKINSSFKKIVSTGAKSAHGDKFEQIQDFSEDSRQYYALDIIDGDDDFVINFENLENEFDVWIDGKHVNEFDTFYKFYTIPVYLRSHLTPGKHRLRIGVKKYRRIIFDGDVIFDGIEPITMTISNHSQNIQDCKILVEKSFEEIYSGVVGDLDLEENYA